MDNHNQQRGGLRAIAAKAWSSDFVRAPAALAIMYAGTIGFLGAFSTVFMLATMQHFNDSAEGFRQRALEVAVPAEGQCLYVDPGREQKIVFREPQLAFPLRVMAALVPFADKKDFNIYDLGRMPAIETASCEALRPELVISTDQAAALKRDAFAALMQGPGAQDAREKAIHRGMLDAVLVPR